MSGPVEGATEIDLRIPDPSCRAALDDLTRLVRAVGGRVLLVGGCVRDAALGLPAKDLDVEVFGVAPDTLLEALSRRFELDLVGRAFGVIKLRGAPIDVSLPRREAKTGPGHKGFAVDSDPHMSLAEAAARRDFTINAISLDPVNGEVIDPFDGLRDLRARVLRHTTGRFAEDPLRVLRGMQFSARFELEPAPETVALCRTIETEELPRERIFGEWRKLVLLGVRPSRGLAFLRECDWLRHYPELERLVGCEQDPEWHPEGDVWVHTMHCMDAYAGARVGEERDDLVVGLAVLCHDVGKPETTQNRDGRVIAHGHEARGEAVTRELLERFTEEARLVDDVARLVGEHLKPVQLFESRAGDAAIRRLARRVGRIDRLVRVAAANWKGRPPLDAKRFEAGEWLLERARALAIESDAPRPLVMGRHLLEIGSTPGPELGRLLETCFEAQLEGRFTNLEEGLAFARTLLAPTSGAGNPDSPEG